MALTITYIESIPALSVSELSFLFVQFFVCTGGFERECMQVFCCVHDGADLSVCVCLCRCGWVF